MICTLAEVGIEGVEIQDKQPLTDEDKAQMFDGYHAGGTSR